MRGLLVRVEHSDPGRIEKSSQYLLVRPCPGPAEKSCAQFSQNDKRKIDALGLLNALHDFAHAAAEIHITVRVEGQSHFQSLASIWSCAERAASKALSSCQEPARASRSWKRGGCSAKPSPIVSASMIVSFKLWRDCLDFWRKDRSTCG